MSKKMTETMSGNASMPSQPTPIEAAVPPQEALPPLHIAVKINSLRTGGSKLATASITLNGGFAVRGVKIMDGPKGPFISMPSYKVGDEYRDICYPCTKESKAQFDKAVLDAYQQELTQVASGGQHDQHQGIHPPEMKM